MPAGYAWRSFPFGPWTSTAPGVWSRTLTVTPLGIAMGFLPIRDISDSLPDVAEHFAADASLRGCAARHHPSRRRQDAGAEPAEDFGDVLLAEIDAAPRSADALDAGDEPLAVRTVLQEQPQRPGLHASLGRRLVQELEALNVSFILEDARDLHLHARRGHVDTRVLGAHGVPNTGQHVCDRVCHSSLLVTRGSLLVARPNSRSPAALGHSGDVTLERQLPEAQPAQGEFPHVAARAPAEAAAIAQPDPELGFLLLFRDFGGSGHRVLSTLAPCSRYEARNGIPINCNSFRASWSVRAVVTTETFMPRALSTFM